MRNPGGVSFGWALLSNTKKVKWIVSNSKVCKKFKQIHISATYFVDGVASEVPIIQNTSMADTRHQNRMRCIQLDTCNMSRQHKISNEMHHAKRFNICVNCQVVDPTLSANAYDLDPAIGLCQKITYDQILMSANSKFS